MTRLPLGIVLLFCLSCRTPETPAPRTPAAESATSARPSGPGPANLAVTCVQPKVGCDPTGFSMAVLGDVAHCSVMGPGSLRLELKSSNDEHDGVLVAFEGYRGPGSYALDDPAKSFIQVSDGVAWNGCDGPTTSGKVVTAGDPSCPSPACSVQVTDDAPAAPFPRSLTFAVHCESLCENGSEARCQGPFDVITKVTCG